MDTDPCCCMATNLDMALSGSMGRKFTIASGGSTGYSYQATSLHPRVSSSTSLHNSQTVLRLPSLYHILVFVQASAAGGSDLWLSSLPRATWCGFGRASGYL